MPFPALVAPLGELSDAEATRTARHRALAGFGDLAQRRLAASHVAVVGAGGLGSPVILALAAAGVGTITVIDDDDVEASNLQRQIVHRVADLGGPKVASAERVAADLSPTTVVRPLRVRIDAANARDLLAGAHVVVDGSDTFETRTVVAAACEGLGVPLVWGVVQEFHAQATVFWSRPPAGTAPVRLSDLYETDAVGEVPSCAQVGVLGALCLQVGGLLAAEAIKLLTGVGEPLFGRVAVIDALRGRTHEVPLRPASASSDAAPAPATADREPGATAPAGETAHRVTPSPAGATANPGATVPAHATAEPTATSAAASVPHLRPDEARAAHDAGAVFVDVREPWETARGTIADSLLMPLAELLADPTALGDGPVVVVCQVGLRAQRAAAALRAAGVEAAVLAGGLDAWNRATVPA